MSARDAFKNELRRLLPHVSHWVVAFEDCGPATVAVRHARFPNGLGYARCGGQLHRPPAELAGRFALYINGIIRREPGW